MSDLVERLYDLQKQANVEQSHFYVGSLAAEAAAYIEKLEKTVLKLVTEDE